MGKDRTKRTTTVLNNYSVRVYQNTNRFCTLVVNLAFLDCCREGPSMRSTRRAAFSFAGMVQIPHSLIVITFSLSSCEWTKGLCSCASNVGLVLVIKITLLSSLTF